MFHMYHTMYMYCVLKIKIETKKERAQAGIQIQIQTAIALLYFGKDARNCSYLMWMSPHVFQTIATSLLFP